MAIVEETLVPVYRYYIADLITGQIVMEIPFQGVSWERKISTAGQFTGSIAVPSNNYFNRERTSSIEDHFDLYNTTVPGKYGLYVLRNGVCVWGGIIWSRSYDIVERTLSVTALEFISYLYHRVFWKSFTTDTYEYTGDEETVKEFLELLISHVNTDQASVNEGPYGYLASDVHKRINNYQRSGTTLTLVTEEPHGYSVGDIVNVGGFVAAGIANGAQIDGTYTIPVSGITNDRQFNVTTATSATVAMTTVSLDAPTHTILKSTADLLLDNANIRITTDISADLDTQFTDAYGDSNPFTFRGSEMRYVGEILQNFAQNGVPTRTTAGSLVPRAAVGANSIRVIRKSLSSNVALVVFIVFLSVTL
jgi:hypothetical protein